MKDEKNIKSFNENARTPCETFTRSMGFVRPTKYFNVGKYAEFLERNMFKESNALTTGFRHQNLLRKAA